MADLLKRKPDKRGTITISVPLSVKQQWHKLVEQANQYGFDMTGSISDALQALIRKAEGEIQQYARHNGTAAGSH